MNSGSCPICLDTVNDKIKASPDSCEHIFCLQCLERWSKMGSYCPVDRKRFKKILNLESDSLIQVKPHKRKRKRTVYDFSTSCEVCSGSTNANVLLLCDCCDLAYHTHCLKPPLKEVPAGLWFCPTCTSVEIKLKKKNGITKEVEAEGDFDSTSLKEKVIDETNSKGNKKLDTPAPASKESYSLQACYDIISDFEGMAVEKSTKDASSSSGLDSVNKLDKIYKTFDNTVQKRLSLEHADHLKTYSMTNANRKSNRVKQSDLSNGKKSISETVSINPDDTSLDKGNASSDVDLQNHSNRAYDIMPDKPLENSQRRMSQRLKSMETFDAPALKNSVEKRVTRKSVQDTEKSLKEKQKIINSPVIVTYCEDSMPSSSRVRNKPAKGTSKNLIQFSVFQRIEGIDASQEICSQISSVQVPLPSNIHLQRCSICYDQFFAKSELQCKLCKLKYFNTKESKRFSNYVKNFKKGLSNKKYENIKWNEVKYENRSLGTQERMSSSTYVLERRKRSLMRTLKKIQDSKCINTINVN